jgi:RHS repeat-associated protein
MMLTDENGNVNEDYSYGPYGELLSGDASKTAYLYNGEYGVATDANGLYYMRARYYNVAIKRFINQDVITGTIDNSSSLNKYAYVQGSVKQVAKSGNRVTKHVAKKVITKSKAAVKGAKKAVKNTVEKVAQKGKNIKKSIEKCQNCQK